MFTLWFGISWWKVNICLDKRKHCITKYYHFVFDEKNIAVHNIEFDSAFDFFYMSYTLKIHADCLRCCSLLVSRGKQMNLDRELSTCKGLTFGNSIKTQINSKMNTLKIGLQGTWCKVQLELEKQRKYKKVLLKGLIFFPIFFLIYQEMEHFQKRVFKTRKKKTF